MLDWQRFSSDALLRNYRAEQAVLLRDAEHRHPVTMNLMGFHRRVDSWAWAPHLDVVANDWYADPQDPDAAVLGR